MAGLFSECTGFLVLYVFFFFNIFLSWQWLGLDKELKKLVVETTANQVKFIKYAIGKLLSIGMSESSSVDHIMHQSSLNFVTLFSLRTFGVYL